MPALWTISVNDLKLPVRGHNALVFWRKLPMAWHAAALCDTCLLRTRNCGVHTMQRIRDALHRAGFPGPVARCGEPLWKYDSGTYLSPCERDLAQCRAMLERGEWE